MSSEKIEILANIKDVITRNLNSGDKEVRILLTIVGPSTIEAIRLGTLDPAKQVKVIYDPEEPAMQK